MEVRGIFDRRFKGQPEDTEMFLLIDNYDSFTYNLAHLFGALGAEVTVLRNDEIDADGAERLAPSHLVVSPGPGRPAAAGASEEILRWLAPTTPTLLSAFDGGNSSCPEELWLRWTASSDDAAPSGIEYEVRVNGTINEVVPVGTGTITYTEVLGANTVTIVAVDQAGNASAPSNAITVVTNWAPGGCGI